MMLTAKGLWIKWNSSYCLFKIVIEEKRLSVSGAISLMNVSSINWLIDLIHSVESYLDERERKEHILNQIQSLKDILLSEMGERSQLFESELKKLLNIN